jgi:signal transduction histidine kinase
MTALTRKSLRSLSLLMPADAQGAWSDIDRLLFACVEYERNQIAQQIHDGPSGNLFALRFSLASLRSRLIKQGSDLAPIPAQLMELLEATISQLRNISNGIPEPRSVRAFRNALSALASQTSADTRVKCTLHWQPRLRIHGKPMKQLFRIASECVRYAVHQARARNVHIHIGNDARGLVMKISDDGIGLGRLTKDRAGLKLIAHRARSISADLKVRTGKNRGTEWICRIPITAARKTAPDEKRKK